MTETPRYRKILELLDIHETCMINELATLLSVSHMTIRRDLKSLQERGFVQLSYGGTVKKRFINSSPLYDTKQKKYSESKQIVGRLANELIEPGMVIFLDGGTTVKELAMNIRVPVTVVTLDLSIALDLNDNPDVKVILCPGEVMANNRACYNSEAMIYLSEQIIDLAFIGADGFNLTDGALTTSQIKADCKWIAIQKAMQAILLVDISKLNLRCRHKITDLTNFSHIVTDQPLPEAISAILLNKDVTLISEKQQ